VLTKLEEERRREDWIAPDNSFRVLEVIAGSYSGGKRAKGRERERERERGGGRGFAPVRSAARSLVVSAESAG